MQYKVNIYSIKKSKKIGKEVKKKLIGSMIFNTKAEAIKQAQCYKLGENLIAEVVEI